MTSKRKNLQKLKKTLDDLTERHGFTLFDLGLIKPYMKKQLASEELSKQMSKELLEELKGVVVGSSRKVLLKRLAEACPEALFFLLLDSFAEDWKEPGRIKKEKRLLDKEKHLLKRAEIAAVEQAELENQLEN